MKGRKRLKGGFISFQSSWWHTQPLQFRYLSELPPNPLTLRHSKGFTALMTGTWISGLVRIAEIYKNNEENIALTRFECSRDGRQWYIIDVDYD
jgi:hypothetical protein